MVYTHHSSSSPPITPSRLPAEVIATSLVHSQSAPGDLSVVVPPVPIPNTAVKHHSANGSRTQGSARVGRCQIIKAALRGGFFASTRHDRSLAATASMASFFVAGGAELGRGAGRGAERFFGRGPDSNQGVRNRRLRDVAWGPMVKTGAIVPGYSAGVAACAVVSDLDFL